MKIYSMTATFGKLEHETLTLKPGLNVLTAPNEWGKSTWCAFLLAMLYGLDTRAKTTRSALADKERYAPWSGNPMAGRIDLEWNGRDITIERRSRGRTPLGSFRAYETASGLDVPELTAANCGQQLLGVEQSVFRRTAFVRLSDLPVTQDAALRSRLNALVTTGDESGDALRLEQNLRDLKNRCRYNRTGLLPQAMGQQQELERKLSQVFQLEAQLEEVAERQEENELLLAELENHEQWLLYRQARADERRVSEAQQTRDSQVLRLQALQAQCAQLPAQQLLDDKCTLLEDLNGQWNRLQQELAELAPEPQAPRYQQIFRDLNPDDAVKMAEEDTQEFSAAAGRTWLVLMILGMICLVTAGALACLRLYLPAVLDLAVGAATFLLGIYRRAMGQHMEALYKKKYGTLDSGQWRAMASAYGWDLRNYEELSSQRKTLLADLDDRREFLQRQRVALCEEADPEETLRNWQQMRACWQQIADAERDAMAAEKHLEDLMAMAKRATEPEIEDTLSLSPAETHDQLALAQKTGRHLQNRQEQLRGQMEAMESQEDLAARLEQTRRRVAQLEDTYAALTIALETLQAATTELQRKFAPPITRKAQQLLSGLTGGRYDRLMIAEDFSLRAGAVEEDTLHDALWRSDGTVDQLYLALRLAVAEELTPEAPLVLDDALARFDDERMEAALAILQDMAQDKQILLFTCQQREARALNQLGAV